MKAKRRVDSLEYNPHSENTPVEDQTASLAEGAAGNGRGSPESPPPAGEAAAFVASLFSGFDQPGAIAEEVPRSEPHGESAPAATLLEAASAPADLPDAEPARVLSRLPSHGAPRARRRLTVPALIALALLIFGCGLLVGCVLGRLSIRAGKSNIPRASLGTASAAVPSKMAHDAAAPHSKATVPGSGPAANPAAPSVPPLTENHDAGAVLSRVGGDDGLETRIAAARRAQSEAPTHGPITAARPRSADGTRAAARASEHIHYKAASADSSHAANAAAADISSPSQAGAFPGAVEAGPRASETGLLGAMPLQQRHPSNLASLAEIHPCQLIYSVQPIYPRKALKEHIEGDVQLQLVVDAEGSVGNVTVLSGPPSLAPAAIDAVRQFRYKPASFNGQAIETVQTVDLSFHLNN